MFVSPGSVFITASVNRGQVSAEDIFLTSEEAENILEGRQTTDGSTWWFANIQRQGTIPYGTNSSYVLFRNVKDYGAKGITIFPSHGASKMELTDHR